VLVSKNEKILAPSPLNTGFTLFTFYASTNKNLDKKGDTIFKFRLKGMDMLRLLIVEDSNVFRQTLRESLKVSFPKIAIDEAANGLEALRKVDAFAPDLILMDIRLPGESGLGLTQKIKSIYPDIIIFLLTGYDSPECREAALRYGADHYIPKESFKRVEALIKSYFRI
jgi:CheY-like chemotaxis protein